MHQAGQIRTLASGTLPAEPFLGLSDKIVTLSPTYDERSLLGLAFHPDHAFIRRWIEGGALNN